MTEKQNTKGKLLKSCRKIDIFGIPVTLVHEGHPMFKTEIGSMFTLMLVVFCLTFTALKLETVVKQDSSQKYS